jgi:hypothetical protein
MVVASSSGNGTKPEKEDDMSRIERELQLIEWERNLDPYADEVSERYAGEVIHPCDGCEAACADECVGCHNEGQGW